MLYPLRLLWLFNSPVSRVCAALVSLRLGMPVPMPAHRCMKSTADGAVLLLMVGKAGVATHTHTHAAAKADPHTGLQTRGVVWASRTHALTPQCAARVSSKEGVSTECSCLLLPHFHLLRCAAGAAMQARINGFSGPLSGEQIASAAGTLLTTAVRRMWTRDCC